MAFGDWHIDYETGTNITIRPPEGQTWMFMYVNKTGTFNVRNAGGTAFRVLDSDTFRRFAITNDVYLRSVGPASIYYAAKEIQ